MFNNNLKLIKSILYRLKRSYGLPIVFFQVVTNTGNLVTGVNTTTYRNIRIRRAIVLPVSSLTDFVYDLSFIAANKNFTYGGYFNVGNRIVVIENSEIPVNRTINLEDQCKIEHEMYKIKNKTKTMDNRGTILLLETLDNYITLTTTSTTTSTSTTSTTTS